MNKWSKGFWADLAERVGAVFVYSLITLLTMDNVLERVNFETLWPIVVLPTVLSLLKGLLANLKDPASGASLLNPPPGPVVTETERGAIDRGLGLLLLVVLVAFILIVLIPAVRV